MNRIFKNLIKDKDLLEIINGASVSFFLRFGGLLFGYLLTLLIANLFGAQVLGDYVLVITVFSLFTLFAKLGLDTTAIRFIASYASQNKWKSIVNFRRKTSIILVFTSVFFSILMYSFSDVIATLINLNADYIRFGAFFILPVVFFILNYESLRGLKRIAEFSFFYRVSQSLFCLVSILIIYQFINHSSVPIYAYFLTLLIVTFFSFLSYRYWLTKMSHGIEKAKEEITSYSCLFKISIPLMFAQSVQFIIAWSDKLMLGAMTSSEDVAIYYTSFRLSMFAAAALMAVTSIAAPKFAEFYANNDFDGLQKVAMQSTKIIFWSTLPLVLVFFIFPEFFLGLFGDEFKLGVTAFILLSCGRLISSFSGSVGSILQMTDNHKIYGIIMLLGAVINIVFNLALIPINNPFATFGISGINGAAIASMCSLSFWNLCMVLVVKKKFGFYTFYIPFFKR